MPELPAISSGSRRLSAADHELRLNLFGRLDAEQGILASWPACDLNGTLIPEISLDGGDNWKAAQFAEPAGGVTSLAYSGDGTNSADSFLILTPGGVTHARVRISAYTSGSITVTLLAVPMPANYLYGSDGTNLRAVTVTNTTPAADAYGIVTRGVGSSGAGTSTTDDAAFTPGTTEVTPAGFVYQATPDQVNDGDAGAARMSISRGVVIGGMETPTGDSMLDDTNNALQTTPVTVVSVGGQSATSTTTVYPNCPSQVNLRVNAAQTASLVCGVTDKVSRICALFVLADGDTDLTFVRGTGTCCATFQTTIAGPIDLTSANGRGFTWGNGAGVIMDGVANTCSICVTSASGGVNVTIFARYAVY